MTVHIETILKIISVKYIRYCTPSLSVNHLSANMVTRTEHYSLFLKRLDNVL